MLTLRARGDLRALRAVESEIGAMPEVSAVGGIHLLPLTKGLRTGPFVTDELGWRHPEAPFEADWRFVTPGYFQAMGIRMLGGRTFESHEAEGVVIVDSRLAALAWPDREPVGHRLQVAHQGADAPEWHRVVGVVDHARHADLTSDGRPTLYFPAGVLDSPGDQMALYFAVRASGDPAALIEPLRRRVGAGASVQSPRTLRSYADATMLDMRAALAALGSFAVLAIVLAASSLYSILGHSVRSHAGEIGIRVALGANGRQVHREVLAQAARRVLPGLTIGAVGVFAVAPAVDPFLYGVRASDPLVIAASALLVLAIAGVAAYRPARRAALADPVVVLRGE